MTANEQAVAMNCDRASDAEAALVAFACVKEARKIEQLDDSYQERREWLTDLLTDLRHWAREHGLDFSDVAQLSEIHFESEVDEERLEEESAGGAV